ncbi:flagella synthesis protein FlgN [Pectobacterium versatile]|jgi:flagella synthesis protein FlgN|uniref:Flagella synthesis chaperone protein FlgN n=1 Tax=Pectobacterium versatile TaxID=2488639 RepID=A0A221TBR8_9GAMM|nr:MULTISPECIES: flagellar export chaperone FlgN [Pectobacterium]ASN86240.1 Flagella synthesis protein FlgN [Pectobacterium versatile]AVT58227.1 flagella synthesis protein [Pectobacterium versatile]AZK63362.1 flagellar biosynthesis protein FlgN [Pectobacterium versatile]MBA0158462.1 flagellar export chaperone FlgN [Pectobacterium versatile]MBA0162288.1 flagellar export chaperone FlgN [Pectobacterium versatile]
MENLQSILDQLLSNLRELDVVMSEEQTLLCAGHINSIALQQVTEKKTSLLATMQHLEARRHETESTLKLQAPYDGIEKLSAYWQQVQELTRRLNDQNQHNGLLLSRHIAYTNEAINILKPRHGQGLYGPDGQSKGVTVGGRKITF